MPKRIIDCETERCFQFGYILITSGCLEGHITETVLCEKHYRPWVIRAHRLHCVCGRKIIDYSTTLVSSIHPSWHRTLNNEQAKRQTKPMTGGWVTPTTFTPTRNSI